MHGDIARQKYYPSYCQDNDSAIELEKKDEKSELSMG